MPVQPVPSQLEEIRSEQHLARRRAAAWLGGLVAAGVVGVAHLVGHRAAAVAGACALAASAWWLLIERRAAANRRRLLDELILNGWRNVAPDDVRAREGELLERRNRRVLARALENQVLDVWSTSPSMNPGRRSIIVELRRHRDRIRQLAFRLRDDVDLVDPRGIVMVEKLITDGSSPLHAGPTAAIEPTLARIEQALDRAA